MSRLIAALTAASFALATPATAGASSGASAGVHVRTVSQGVVVSFGDSAARRFREVRGRDMTVRCTHLGAAQGLARVDQSESATVRVPRRRKPILVRLPSHRYDLCEVGRAGGQPFPAIPLTQRGRTYVDERGATQRLLGVIVLATSIAPQASSWPTADRVVGRAKRGVAALPTADAMPPNGAVGYFSDGAKHMAVATLSAAGRRLFIDINGDVTSTNVLEYLNAG